ncbi:MAG: hypothetical protein VXY89_15925, partial [SAR324 cluster bacterium]|nr:hypothetical protein [SAR324 cluster bacterium]
PTRVPRLLYGLLLLHQGVGVDVQMKAQLEDPVNRSRLRGVDTAGFRDFTVREWTDCTDLKDRALRSQSYPEITAHLR